MRKKEEMSEQEEGGKENKRPGLKKKINQMGKKQSD